MFTMYRIALWFQLNSSDQAFLATSKNFLFLSVLCTSCLSLLTLIAFHCRETIFIFLLNCYQSQVRSLSYTCHYKLTIRWWAWLLNDSHILDNIGRLVQILRLKFGRYFEAELCSRFWSGILINLWHHRTVTLMRALNPWVHSALGIFLGSQFLCCSHWPNVIIYFIHFWCSVLRPIDETSKKYLHTIFWNITCMTKFCLQNVFLSSVWILSGFTDFFSCAIVKFKCTATWAFIIVLSWSCNTATIDQKGFTLKQQKRSWIQGNNSW